jgi:hypothetical protein
MSAIPATHQRHIAPVSARRSARERFRDAMDPLWRRLLWEVAVRRAGRPVAVCRTPHDSRVSQLEGDAAARAREIIARRLTR